MPANALVRDVARRLRERLEATLGSRVEAVRIFGSQARGDARSDSDLDVFVLLDEDDLDTRDLVFRTAHEVWCAMDGVPVITPLIRSRAAFEEMLKYEQRLALDIMREGIPA